MAIRLRTIAAAAAQARRGDLSAAERWFKLVDRAADAEARLASIARKLAVQAEFEKRAGR
jgi:hypothetical protein